VSLSASSDGQNQPPTAGISLGTAPVQSRCVPGQDGRTMHHREASTVVLEGSSGLNDEFFIAVPQAFGDGCAKQGKAKLIRSSCPAGGVGAKTGKQVV
jgi:hypothetical protein